MAFRLNNLLFAGALILAAAPSWGEVYWSDLHGVVGASGAEISPEEQWRTGFDFLSSWEEPMRINGVDAGIEIGISLLTPRELVARLAAFSPRPAIAASPDGELVLSWNLSGNRTLKLLISIGDGSAPPVIFATTMPDPLPPAPELPAGFPRVAGAQLLRVTEFPRIGAVSAELSSDLPPSLLLEDAAAQLKAAGWMPMGGELGSPRATGEIYYRPKTGELTMVAVRPPSLILYRRPLSPEKP